MSAFILRDAFGLRLRQDAIGLQAPVGTACKARRAACTEEARLGQLSHPGLAFRGAGGAPGREAGIANCLGHLAHFLAAAAAVFDDALESALRIGLEQSQYVNVLPDLKVRESVKRMQLDPATTEVSREIGSEIAIRDGARALILPTIAEIGGRVRITAEVIDPQTQTTVYSETADGVGKESILPSLDAINKRLRVRLGEALATVTEESQPLEKVATANLDALRAYSLGYKETSLAISTRQESSINTRSRWIRILPGRESSWACCT